jgi:ferritin-like metal-binding protein YciE
MATKTQSNSVSAVAKKSAASKQDNGTSTGLNSGSGMSGSTSTSTQKSGKQQTASSESREKNLQNLFEDLLKDTYDAEKQLLQALPEVAKACYDEELQEAFENHTEQTKKHVERLDKIFDRLRIEKEQKTCEAMKGLIKENQKVISEYEESPVRDSALIIGSQKIEHYEIAAYGSLCELADVLGYSKICDILDRTLAEEEDTDQLLTEIAESINDEAYELSEQEEDFE